MTPRARADQVVDLLGEASSGRQFISRGEARKAIERAIAEAVAEHNERCIAALDDALIPQGTLRGRVAAAIRARKP